MVSNLKEQLKSVLQDLINDREEQATAAVHDYIVAKTSTLVSANAENLSEGTWAFPATVSGARKVRDLLKAEEDVSPEKAKDELYSVFGNDDLFDDLDDAEENGVADVKPIIKRHIERMAPKLSPQLRDIIGV